MKRHLSLNVISNSVSPFQGRGFGPQRDTSQGILCQVILVLGFLTGSTVPSPVLAQGEAPQQPVAIHQDWDALLRESVVGSQVDYSGLKTKIGRLETYLGLLAETDPSTLSDTARLAFWINTYNAVTVKMILDHFPGIASIRDIDDPWGERRVTINGRSLSLDDIEHKIIRAEFEEPRIHFAVNCASKGCPDLLGEAFVAEHLDDQLSRVTQSFLADATKGARAGLVKGKLWGETPTLTLSPILKWYAGDFQKNGSTVSSFVAIYAPKDVGKFVSEHSGDLKLGYFDYDWSLNGP